MSQPPRELFAAERPVRSDFARERTYARRRLTTLAILAVAVGALIYGVWGHSGPSNPADIPTIKAEGSYRQKPAEPGGIDIPHQDVHVYDQLEGKNAPAAPVEHLLPPPENPVVAAAPSLTPSASEAPMTPPPPAPQPLSPVVAQPLPNSDTGALGESAKPIATTVTPSVVPAPRVVDTPLAPVVEPKAVRPTPSPLSIDQIIAKTKAAAKSAPPDREIPSGSLTTAVQLASVPDEAKAQIMMSELQQKYASALGGIPLHLVRADLGAKGVYYRIQSQMISQDAATHLCATFKQMNAGCILVRK